VGVIIGTNSNEIIAQWKKIKEQNLFYSINITVAVGGLLWALYRKMYLVVLLHISLMAAL
jgi:hypothetical protein